MSLWPVRFPLTHFSCVCAIQVWRMVAEVENLGVRKENRHVFLPPVKLGQLISPIRPIQTIGTKY